MWITPLSLSQTYLLRDNYGIDTFVRMLHDVAIVSSCNRPMRVLVEVKVQSHWVNGTRCTLQEQGAWASWQ